MERNYYRWRTNPMVYKDGLFTHTEMIRDLFFYEQNGEYFEFFTGHCLGRKEQRGPYFYVVSDEFGAIIPLTEYSCRRYATKLSAAQFAELVKPYLNYQTVIAKLFQKRFNEWRSNYEAEKRKLAYAQLAAAQKEMEDKQNEKWLDDLLNHRH